MTIKDLRRRDVYIRPPSVIFPLDNKGKLTNGDALYKDDSFYGVIIGISEQTGISILQSGWIKWQGEKIWI